MGDVNVSASVRKRIGVALAVVAVLNALDLVTTRAALGRPTAHEGNPVAWWLLSNGLLEVAKVAVLLVLVVLVFRVRRYHEWVCSALWLVCGWYAAAVFGNVLVWRNGL